MQYGLPPMVSGMKRAAEGPPLDMMDGQSSDEDVQVDVLELCHSATILLFHYCSFFYDLICNIIISLLFFRFDARAPQFLSSELAVLFSKTLFVIFKPEYF